MPVDPEELSQAIAERDGPRLARLAQADPVGALSQVDAAMRELAGGPPSPETLTWLFETDVVLRRFLGFTRRLGPRGRDADVAILRQAYRAGALFVAVGAGISQAAGLPGWRRLVLDVLDYALELGSEAQRARVAAKVRGGLSFAPATAEEEVAKALRDLGPIAAELRPKVQSLRDSIAGRDRYDAGDLMAATDVIRQAFGERFPDHLQRVLYRRNWQPARVHQSIARLVRPKQDTPWPTSCVFSIFTYNFDDLLERAIWAAGLGYTARYSRRGRWLPWHRVAPDHPHAVEIHHVHGFAPRGPVDMRGIDIVFSEKQFELEYKRESSLSRVSHDAHFTNAIGLIIGSSLEDRYAVQELANAPAVRPGWLHYVMMHVKDNRDRSKEHYLGLGLRVLWTEDYDEIPELFDDLAATPPFGAV
jgi:hypothetical protein